MKKIVSLVVFVFFCSIIGCSQKYSFKRFKEQIDSLDKEAKVSNTTEPYDNFVNHNSFLIDSVMWYGHILGRKIMFLEKINSKRIMKLPVDQRFSDPSFIQIAQLYDEYIEKCSECSGQAKYQKYIFYRELEVETQFDMEVIKNFNIEDTKKERTGLGLGARYIYGNNNSWVGVEFSLFQTYQGPYRIFETNSTTQKKEKVISSVSKSFSGFNFGYVRNLSGPINEFSFNVLHLNAPLVFKPFQLGRQWQVEEFNYGFYRPELGWGYGPFFISGGYSIFFKKEARDRNGLTGTIGLLYPINNRKNNNS